MKNILIMGIYPPPFGGISSLMVNLAPYLVEHGYKVHVFAPGNPGGNIDEDNLKVYKPSRKRLMSISFILSPTLLKLTMVMKKYKLPFFWDLKRTVKIASWLHYLRRNVFAKEKVDIICTFHLFDNGLAGAFLQSIYNVPLIVVNLGEIYVNSSLYMKNANALKFIIDHAQKIISVSKHCADSYKLLNLNPQVEIIYTGIDSSRFNLSVDGSIVRNRYGINSSDFVVLFVGRMIYDMGLHHLIEAIPHVLNKNTRIRFIIAGAEGELSNTIIDLKHKYPDNIFYSVNVPFSELPGFYSASDLVIAPTKDDRACMGLAIKEAMFSGKPVIGNKVGGVPEAIISGKTGLLINTADKDQLSSSILKLQSDRTLLNQMSEAGYARGMKLFSSDVTRNKYVKIFDGLINSNINNAMPKALKK